MARRAMMVRKKRRQQVDWVVNTESYRVSFFALPIAGLFGIPLTYSAGYRGSEMGTAFAAGDREQWTAFVEGSNQRTLAVRGHILLSPSTWAVGVARQVVMRITDHPMDITTGAAVVPTGYTLTNPVYANEQFAWQDVLFDSFQLGTETSSTKRVNASVKRRLAPNHALFLMMQNVGTVVENVTLYLRTLCVK